VHVSNNPCFMKQHECVDSVHFLSGETMLHLAASCRNEKAGLFLVSNGANCSAVNERVSDNTLSLQLVLSLHDKDVGAHLFNSEHL